MSNWRRQDWANSSWREVATPRGIRVSSQVRGPDVLPLFPLMVLLAAFDASAATLIVNGTADASPSPGICSLRDAMQSIINAANLGSCLNSGGDVRLAFVDGRAAGRQP
jgi:hypothetical protein